MSKVISQKEPTLQLMTILQIIPLFTRTLKVNLSLKTYDLFSILKTNRKYKNYNLVTLTKPEILLLGYPNVEETNAASLSDLPEGVIEYNLCPYLSDREITKMTYLKNVYLEQIFSRIQSQRDEKCKSLH